MKNVYLAFVWHVDDFDGDLTQFHHLSFLPDGVRVCRFLSECERDSFLACKPNGYDFALGRLIICSPDALDEIDRLSFADISYSDVMALFDEGEELVFGDLENLEV